MVSYQVSSQRLPIFVDLRVWIKDLVRVLFRRSDPIKHMAYFSNERAVTFEKPMVMSSLSAPTMAEPTEDEVIAALTEPEDQAETEKTCYYKMFHSGEKCRETSIFCVQIPGSDALITCGGHLNAAVIQQLHKCAGGKIFVSYIDVTE